MSHPSGRHISREIPLILKLTKDFNKVEMYLYIQDYCSILINNIVSL